MVEEFPYGMWRSAVSARAVAATTRFGPVAIGADGALWWEETGEDGRVGVQRAAAGASVIDALSRWGGPSEPRVCSWLPAGDGLVAGYDDGRLWLLRREHAPLRLASPKTPSYGHRFADLALGPGGREVWGIGVSRHDGVTVRSLVVVPLDGRGGGRPLLRTTRFVSAPRPSPDGSLVAWITWDLALMPWDGSELRIGRVTPDGVAGERVLLGGRVEAVCQPEWASADSLYVMSDRTGWWNPYEVRVDGAVRALCPWAEEFAWPAGEANRPTYGRLEDGRLAVLHGGADWRLDLLDPDDGTLTPLDLPYDCWRAGLSVRGRSVAGVAGSRNTLASVVAVDAVDGRCRVVRRASSDLPVEYAPDGEFATFAGRDGHEVHATVYPPRNPHCRALPGERVPYLLVLGEGPAAQATRMLDPVIMFFTSRGLGVAEVSPRGSAGYGRAYREQAFGRWGVADVEDCAVVVRGLIERWNADPARLAIRGKGAGGSTALGVLAGTDLCAAATVYAPIVDLDAPGSAAASYLRRLAADSVLLRTPSWIERIGRPVLMFHGLADTVVPPAQTSRLKDVLERNRVPHACLTFAGEGHTFEGAHTIKRALEAELSFYGRVLGFEPPETPHLALTPSSGVPSELGWPADA